MPFSPRARGCPAPQEPAPRCRPGLGGQLKDPWHGRPPGPRRRPGWSRAVSVSAPCAPLRHICGACGLGVFGRCTSSEACQGAGSGTPLKGLGAGWRAAMAGGCCSGPRLRVRVWDRRPVSCSCSSWRLHRLPWTQPGGVPQGPSTCSSGSSRPSAGSLQARLSLANNEEPWCPAEGSLPAPWGGRRTAAMPLPSPGKKIVVWGQK